MIKLLAEQEAQMIELCYNSSDDLGEIAIEDSIKKFTKLLRSRNALFIPQLSMEYRRFVTDLLTALGKIDEELMHKVMPIVLIGRKL